MSACVVAPRCLVTLTANSTATAALASSELPLRLIMISASESLARLEPK